MKVPFLDLKRQYAILQEKIEPAVMEVLRSCSYVGGKYVQRFEEDMQQYLGVTRAIGCGNGTEALVLALRACNVRPGDEVITTPFTFFATAEAIASIGAVPVFVDIKEMDFTIDPDQIEEKISEKTRAILPVHLFGTPCDMMAIRAIADRHHLQVIEDAAQAIGSEYKGRKIGTTADISCFSFYPTKNLGGFGDGGMVTTDKEDLATVLLALREHGAAQNGAKAREILEGGKELCQTAQEVSGLYDPYKYYNYLIGYNSRLDAVQAEILRIKLQHLLSFQKKRTAIASIYTEHLKDLVKTPAQVVNGIHCYHQYVIRTKHKGSLCEFLQERGIGVGMFYPVPLHLQKAFEALGYHPGDLPHAEQAARETVCLPIFPELEEDEVMAVIEAVREFYETEAF